jgi:carbon starvation protein
LGRYILQELTGLRSGLGSVLAAAATLALPAYFVTKKIVDPSGAAVPVWRTFWTLFGSSNQLLAAMVLFAASVWLYKKKMNFRMALIPAIFMTIVSLISLYFVLKPMISGIVAENHFTQTPLLLTTLTILILMIMLIIEGARKFRK